MSSRPEPAAGAVEGSRHNLFTFTHRAFGRPRHSERSPRSEELRALRVFFCAMNPSFWGSSSQLVFPASVRVLAGLIVAPSQGAT